MSSKKRRFSLSIGERLLFLAGGMFCLILITTAMMGGLLARYISTGESEDAARVAAFNVRVNGMDDVQVKYGVNEDTGSYTLTVVNDSEVAVAYSIKVEIEKINFGIKVKLGHKDLENTDDLTDETKTLLDFGTVGTLPPKPSDPAQKSSVTHDLIFAVTDWAQYTQMVNAASRSEELEFTVYVDVVQID